MTDALMGAGTDRGGSRTFAQAITADAFGRAYTMGLAARQPTSDGGKTARGRSPASRIEKRRMASVRRITERLKALRLAAASTPVSGQ